MLKTNQLPETLEEIKIKRIEEKKLEKEAPSTGYPELDNMIKGFVPGHLYTLAGATNTGKSSLAANFAVGVARQPKRRVLYVSLEPDTTIIDYIASAYWNKQFDELEPKDLELSHLGIDVLIKEKVNNINEMVNTIKSLSRYDLIVIDHIGYFITSQTNWVQQQSNVVKQLVSVAKEKKCAIMIIAHLRKKAKHESKKSQPTIDEISGSAAFSQDATDVLLITRELDPNDPNKVKYTDKGMIIIAKSKSGPNGSVAIKFSDRNAYISTPVSEEENSIVDFARNIFGT